MEKSSHINEIAAALARAQSRLRNSPRSSQAHGYRYADLGAVLDDVRSTLGEEGISVAQVVGSEGGEHTIETIIMHMSGQWISGVARIPQLDEGKRMNTVQAFGAAISYMRRYALTAMIGVAQEDRDGAVSTPDTDRAHGERADERAEDAQIASAAALVRAMWGKAFAIWGDSDKERAVRGLGKTLKACGSSLEQIKKGSISISPEDARRVLDELNKIAADSLLAEEMVR